MNTPQLIVLLSEYKKLHPEDAEVCDRMFELIERKPDTYFTRKEFDDGHMCASAWVVNPERTHALLAHHKSLNKLMQFGGHIDAQDTTIYNAVLREVEEETGLKPALAQEDIYDVDLHDVPERPVKNEPAHKHYDVRFLIEVPFSKPNPPAGESQEIAWYTLDDITPELCEDSVLRMARKTAHL